MGQIRNGARTFLNIMWHACRLSRLNGFRGAVARILGDANATAFFTLWDPTCAFVEVLVGNDNWFNQIDATAETSNNEDAPRGI